jgi:DsbC/DsbD-like thiol-disulfide interchange protein
MRWAESPRSHGSGTGAGGEGVRPKRVAACLLLACSFQAPAFELTPVRATLWSERDGISPGQPFTLGLHLVHAPGWHTYWTVPGDAGLPTRLSWRLPAGVRAGPIQWPTPHRLPVGPLVDYGYEGDTLLLTDLQAAPDLPPGSDVRIEAKAQWLMCRDVCIPASQELTLTLPVRDAAALHATVNATAFEHARQRIPGELKLAGASATRAGARLTLMFTAPAAAVPHRLEFFPLEAERIEPSAPQTLTVRADRVLLDLTVSKAASADFHMLRGVLVADGGPDSGGWSGAIELPLQ